MRRPGIEPGSAAWQAAIIPLDQRRCDEFMRARVQWDTVACTTSATADKIGSLNQGAQTWGIYLIIILVYQTRVNSRCWNNMRQWIWITLHASQNTQLDLAFHTAKSHRVYKLANHNKQPLPPVYHAVTFNIIFNQAFFRFGNYMRQKQGCLRNRAHDLVTSSENC